MASTLLCWTMVRVVQTWPDAPLASVAPFVAPSGKSTAHPIFHDGEATLPGMTSSAPLHFMRWPVPLPTAHDGAAASAHPAAQEHPQPVYARVSMSAIASPLPDAAPAPLIVRQSTPPRHLSAEAYLFVRPGSGRAALSPDGQLGGSQLAARLAWTLDPAAPIRIAAVARVYAPLKSRGAEAAAGIDIYPLARTPLRLSIERRQRLDRAGRSAMSAYVAGGFYRSLARDRLIVDGYAQAGLVGFRRADTFVDGAVRIGAPFGSGPSRPLVGAALWGAAQPGVSRLDVGPRASLRLPIAGGGVTAAIEGRFRLAGHARPGSGVALTLAADL